MVEKNTLYIGGAALACCCCVIVTAVVIFFIWRSTQTADTTGSGGIPPPPPPPPPPVDSTIYMTTRDNGNVICPVGFTTAYNYGVNVAAGCSDSSKPCNMCIGTGFPTTYVRNNVSTKWPDRPWKSPTHPADAIPSCAGSGATMGYTGGTYITTPLPASGC